MTLTPHLPDRGDEVQINEHIGNITRINDDGTCTISWWMPTGGPFGSDVSSGVPLAGLKVRQRATTTAPDFSIKLIEELLAPKLPEPPATDEPELIRLIGAGRLIPVQVFGADSYGLCDRFSPHTVGSDCNRADDFLLRPVDQLMTEPVRAAIAAEEPGRGDEVAVRPVPVALVADIEMMTNLAVGSSWPGEMAQRVQSAADRVRAWIKP